jgi:1-acyl-sn-glycerol-3-phosphate acyltransferase
VLLRRLITIPALFLAAVLLTLLFIPLLIVAAIASRVTWAKGSIAALLFVAGYVVFELIGLARLFLVWVLHRNRPDFIEHNRIVQYWWAGALRDWVAKCFRLKFVYSGEQALHGAPCLVFPRHASLADTVLPIVVYAAPEKIKLRYVLKRELLWDPCLDVGGNRIPCHFVDRSGQDSQNAVAAVRTLVAGVGENEGVAMFPEGTRHTPAKAGKLAASTNPELRKLVARWPDLLPPRLGGTLAMLDANPGLDVLFIAHTGFEAASRLHDLLSGAWLNTTVKLHFWRVPFAEIPPADQHKDFLYSQWDRMQRHVAQLVAGEPCI